MDAWFFWKSLGIGLAVAAPVGPMSLLCIHRTLDHGRSAGLVFGAGIAVADLSYAAIAAFGISAISSMLLAATFWIKLAGSVLLLLFGTRIALARTRTQSSIAWTQSSIAPGGPGARAFITAFGLTMANPPTILFFAGVFTAVASIASASQPVTFTAGVFAGSMLWWIILTTLVSRSAALFQPPVLRWINRIAGAVLIGFAVHGFASLD